MECIEDMQNLSVADILPLPKRQHEALQLLIDDEDLKYAMALEDLEVHGKHCIIPHPDIIVGFFSAINVQVEFDVVVDGRKLSHILLNGYEYKYAINDMYVLPTVCARNSKVEIYMCTGNVKDVRIITAYLQTEERAKMIGVCFDIDGFIFGRKRVDIIRLPIMK